MNGLECDDDVSDAGHRVRGLSIGGEVVVFPEDIWFICLGCRVERRGIYPRMDSSVDNATHGASWLWNESHEGATETSSPTEVNFPPLVISFLKASSPKPQPLLDKR